MPKLKDFEVATLFMYLGEYGYPDWAKSKEGQIKALSELTGWNVERSVLALDNAVKCGYAEKNGANT